LGQSEALKRAVGYRAAELIEEGMIVGLGTGSTVRYLLEAIAERRRMGDLSDIIGVATSEDTTRRAMALGIPLGSLTDHPELDLALDGADEIDPSLDLIKGLGGALLREKVVVAAADDFVVLADESKLVSRLGTRAPLPVEIDAFSLGVQIPFLRTLECEPVVRMSAGGEAYQTDGGHLVVDCWFEGGIRDPVGLAAVLDARPGIMEHGLFLGYASRAIVGRPDRCEILVR
jgi:ribose 5-phosphate isomerase A